MFTCDAAGRRRGGVAAQGQHARGVSPTNRSSWGRRRRTNERTNQPRTNQRSRRFPEEGSRSRAEPRGREGEGGHVWW